MIACYYCIIGGDNLKKEPCGKIIKQISDAMETHINSALRDYDLTQSQLMLMLTVWNTAERKLTFKELERKLQVAQPTVVGIISRLESKGLVETMGDASDKRIKLVTLTESGIAKCQFFHDFIEESEDKFFEGISDDERQILRTLLIKIRKNLIEN